MTLARGGGILSNLLRLSQNRNYFRTSVSFESRKRDAFSTKGKADPVTDATRSVIAYNLSERLRIGNTHKLLENLNEYQIVAMPKDLQDEAAALSLKSTAKLGAHRLLHDVFLFEEGSIVFWGVPYEQQKKILYKLTSLEIDPHSKVLIEDEREHMSFELTPSIEKSKLARDVIHLACERDPATMLLDQFAVSHAIALSVKLGIWESNLDDYIDSISWVTGNMKRGKSLNLTRDQVFRKTGEIYELKHRINLSSDLLDLPDVYWDRHDQEVLFTTLTSFLNIRKRTSVINEKLNNCCELMNLLANHMNDKHHLRLEWMIIVLILVEVLFEVSRFVRVT